MDKIDVELGLQCRRKMCQQCQNVERPHEFMFKLSHTFDLGLWSQRDRRVKTCNANFETERTAIKDTSEENPMFLNVNFIEIY